MQEFLKVVKIFLSLRLFTVLEETVCRFFEFKTLCYLCDLLYFCRTCGHSGRRYDKEVWGGVAILQMLIYSAVSFEHSRYTDFALVCSCDAFD